jgi:hypothetical protein
MTSSYPLLPWIAAMLAKEQGALNYLSGHCQADI